MIKRPGPAERRKPEYMESRTPEESPDDDSLDEIRRQLGWDLLPFNGTVPEVPD